MDIAQVFNLNGKPSKIKAVIFDKDGTLFDFNDTWASWTRQMIQTEASGDPEKTAALAEVLGLDLSSNRFRPGSIVIAETIEVVAAHVLQVLPNLSKNALIDRMTQGAAEVPQKPVTDLAQCFAALREMGLKLGIATNDGETPARAHLAQAGVSGFFDFVAGFDSGYGGKPAPGQLIGFCETVGIAPAVCAMVGDSLHDLHAGAAAGMVPIGVLTGPAPAAEIAPHAHVVLPHIGHLPGWLAGKA